MQSRRNYRPHNSGFKTNINQKQLNIIPHRFKVDLPNDLINEILKCKDNKAVRQVGVEWSIAQSKDLVANNVPLLHYYSMGKSDNIYQIASALF